MVRSFISTMKLPHAMILLSPQTFCVCYFLLPRLNPTNACYVNNAFGPREMELHKSTH